MTDRLDSTAYNAKRAFTVTVDSVGQVFASDRLGHALEVMRARGFGANLVYERKFQAFINHEGKARPCDGCPAFIETSL